MTLRHRLTGNIGEFVKESHPTGKPTTWIIKLASGKVYFAPSYEFEEYKPTKQITLPCDGKTYVLPNGKIVVTPKYML